MRQCLIVWQLVFIPFSFCFDRKGQIPIEYCQSFGNQCHPQDLTVNGDCSVFCSVPYTEFSNLGILRSDQLIAFRDGKKYEKDMHFQVSYTYSVAFNHPPNTSDDIALTLTVADREGPFITHRVSIAKYQKAIMHVSSIYTTEAVTFLHYYSELLLDLPENIKLEFISDRIHGGAFNIANISLFFTPQPMAVGFLHDESRHFRFNQWCEERFFSSP